MCHGVPSPKVWNTYLSEKEKLLGKGKSVSFRNKSTGWKSYSVNFLFEGGNEIKELASANPYMRLFLSDICLRPSCHDCRYKSMERPADITLGDSWGIGNYKPHMDDDKGVSVVLIHSEKGRKMFDKCKENMVFEKAELNKILPPAADSRNSVAAHPKRNEFFRLLNEGATVHQLTKLIEAPLSVKVKNKVNGLVRKFVKK